jgi:Holliday junction resolvase RusA-like endonuclease
MPDLDKLIRTVGDALKVGGLIADDARICRLTADKRDVVGWTGATIAIGQLPPL